MSLWQKGEQISQVVVRDVALEERGSTCTLNDVSPAMVDEARKVLAQSTGAVVRYLRFFVAKAGLADIEDFIQEVLLGTKDVGTWRIRDCLVYPTLNDPIRLFTKSYWDGLERDGVTYVRVRPSSRIHPTDPIAGAVGILKKNVRYWEEAPVGFDYFFFDSADHIESISVDAVDIFARRSLGHVLACWTALYRKTHPDQVTADDLLGAVRELSNLVVTEDARICAAALAQEIAAFSGDPDFAQQAGFLGPDEWYRVGVNAR